MTTKSITQLFFILILISSLFSPASDVQAAQPSKIQAQSTNVTAYDLIIAMNTLRVSHGLPALVEDPIIDAVAQSTAEIMAANQMSWHIGDVSGRLTSAGYGGGAKVWGTENFAVGNQSIDEIMVVWSDDSHMIPAVNPAYCNVGAGAAKSSNGMTYYVLQAAYTANKSCGQYKSPGGTTTLPGGTTDEGRQGGVSQMIVPVKIAEPDADGKVYHVVQAGQSFWAIAITYKITIKDLETWNNLSKDSKLQIGQRLFIPDKNTIGYATPTPVGMIETSLPDPDGKIVHTVQSYQTLTTIAQAYSVSIDTILAVNGIQASTPLQIGQALVINPGSSTPSPTPPTLTPLEKLTPESDGKYYHITKEGENLTWIASLYQVDVNQLMAWNGLNGSTVIQPGFKLLLQVTPPATITPTPGPATETPTATLVPPSPTATPVLSVTATLSPDVQSFMGGRSDIAWFVLGGLGVAILVLLFLFSRNQKFLRRLK